MHLDAWTLLPESADAFLRDILAVVEIEALEFRACLQLEEALISNVRTVVEFENFEHIVLIEHECLD